MFSNRSVRVHPSDPAIEYGAIPDERSVLPVTANFGQVLGAVTPASLNAFTLFQTVDLFDALKNTP